MEHVQNATLAGGVAMGTAASMPVQPFGALIVGSVAGILSTCGYSYIKVILKVRNSLSLKPLQFQINEFTFQIRER